jgi:leucyl aminopeptidase
VARTARTAALRDGLDRPTIAIPVVVVGGEGRVPAGVPEEIGGVAVPRVLDAGWCERQGLKSEAGSLAVVRSMQEPNVAFVSLGSDPQDAQAYRLAGAAAARVAGEESVTVLLATRGLDDPGRAAQSLVEGALLASYRYKDKGESSAVDVVALGNPLPSVADHDAVTRGVERGALMAEAVNWAKFLVDSPAGHLPPRELARRIDERLGDDEHVDVEVWTESRIREERLGGLLGVGRGSAQPTRLVTATYDPAPGERLSHVVLVGKGVTFDSGGLSLKSGEGMMTMKTDMTGAAVVMAATSLASRLGLRVKVTAIAPLTENLVGEQATKPGDVLTIRNGLTIEVLNTDAEGRLILADGLSLAAELAPDAIIDVATLTGAQRVALGDEVGGLFSSDDDLAAALAAASAKSGEMLWRLPLVDAYDAMLDSDVADMKNIGKAGAAGSIVAALLLRRFTDGRPWAHLDIAGPGRADAPRGYVTKGATAFATRTLVEYLAARGATAPDAAPTPSTPWFASVPEAAGDEPTAADEGSSED